MFKIKFQQTRPRANPLNQISNLVLSNRNLFNFTLLFLFVILILNFRALIDKEYKVSFRKFRKNRFGAS